METELSILIVEDNPGILQSTKVIFEKEGYKVYEASNGPEGLEKTKSVVPDFVLTDVEIPDMDGIELCAKIKNDARLRHVFVILISGIKKDTENKTNGLLHGGDAYLTRPIAPKVLLAWFKAFSRIKITEDELYKKNMLLEKLIEDKTLELINSNQELFDQNKKLEKYHDLFTQRELRVYELKETIKKLETDLDKANNLLENK